MTPHHRTETFESKVQPLDYDCPTSLNQELRVAFSADLNATRHAYSDEYFFSHSQKIGPEGEDVQILVHYSKESKATFSLKRTNTILGLRLNHEMSSS